MAAACETCGGTGRVRYQVRPEVDPILRDCADCDGTGEARPERTGTPEDYDAVLRAAADDFVMVLAVAADRAGKPPAELADEALRDAVARATESGVLGTSIDEGS